LTSAVTASRTRSGDPLTDVVDLIEPDERGTTRDGHVGADQRTLARVAASAVPTGTEA